MFGRVDTKKNEALHRMNFWDNQEKGRELSLEETKEKNLAREEYKKWSLMEAKVKKIMVERREQEHYVLP